MGTSYSASSGLEIEPTTDFNMIARSGMQQARKVLCCSEGGIMHVYGL